MLLGVFNCRFANASASSVAAAALKRKKKKPTTFVPPPSIGSVSGRSREDGEGGEDDRCLLQPDAIPFWCRPLSRQYNQQVKLISSLV